MTLLSILACDSIAVPLSSAFPASELRYILENSEAVTLLSSSKFQEKAEEVLKEGLEHLHKKPVLNIVEKRLAGNGEDEVQLVPLPMTKGGMMLYTSGTTSRPVYITSDKPKVTTDIFHRKASSFLEKSSLRKRNHFTKPGNTPHKTTSSTSFPSIIFMALSMPSSHLYLPAQRSSSCSLSTSTQSGSA